MPKTAEEWEAIYTEMFNEASDKREAIFLAVGAASACWSNLEGAGEFQSDRAKVLAELLYQYMGG